MNFGEWLDTFFHGFDYTILEFFSSFQSETGNFIVEKITFLGSLKFTIFIAVLGIILLFFKKTRKVGITLIVAIAIGTLITNVIAKPLIERARPYITMANDQFHDWYVAAGGHIESDKSFPSGHTTAAFEIGTALFWSLRKKYSWIFLVIAFLIGLTRLYLMIHYPTDVIGGMITGFFAGSMAYIITNYIYIRKKSCI